MPLDHGISFGPMDGLTDIGRTIDEVVDGGATAVLMHKGLIPKGYGGHGRDVGLIQHLSASTSMGTTFESKVLVSSVEEALSYGADAVSAHINVGAASEPHMLRDMGMVSESCTRWGMPLMIMAYHRGSAVSDRFDPGAIAHAARVATELGADLVKCPYTGDQDSFSRVVDSTLAPLLIAGGEKMSTAMDILDMVEGSIAAGGRGVSIGRNVFQYNDVRGMTAAISEIVLHGATAKEASLLLERR